MIATLILKGRRIGRQNTRQYFNVTQNIGGQILQMDTSILIQNNLPLNNFQNSALDVVYNGVRNRGGVNSRCWVTRNGQNITCLIQNTQLPVILGMQVNVPIENFL